MEESNPVADPGSRSRAGLAASGDLFVFPVPARWKKGTTEDLVLMDDDGIRGQALSGEMTLVWNIFMRFDRSNDEVCGVFRAAEQLPLMYSCYRFAARTWRRLSPPGYSIIHTAWDHSGRTLFHLATRSEYVPEAPWYYVLRVDASTGVVLKEWSVDPETVRGNPQFIALSQGEDILMIVTAPFQEGNYVVDTSLPYVLQVFDLRKEQVIREKRVASGILEGVFDSTGARFHFYAWGDNTVYTYDLYTDNVSITLPLESADHMLYNATLHRSGNGLLVVDQNETQTVVRLLAEDGRLRETVRYDFLSFYVRTTDDGRLMFREFQLDLKDFETEWLEDRTEVFHTVDLETMQVVDTRTVRLPGPVFRNGVFYLLPALEDP